MPLYTIAGKIIAEKPIRGVIIDGIQLLVSGARFNRAPLTYSEAWLTEFMQNVEHKIALASSYFDNNYWPMNETACGNYGGCAFKKVCSRSPEVRDIFLNADFKVNRWDPLITRETGTTT
jgi:hypothetical protein